MRRSETELHNLSGPYVLDALGSEEREVFERHLDRCDTCSQEVREFREATARLAYAASAAPPAALKSSVLAAVARTRQQAPEPVTPNAASSPRRGSAVSFSEILGMRAARLAGRVALATAIVVLAVLAAVGNWRSGGHTGGSDSHIAAVLTAPDAVSLTSAVHNGGTSTVVMSPHEGALVFAASGLPPLPRSKCYMLWLMRSGGDIRVSRLPPSVRSMTGPVVATGIENHDHLGLTVEPVTGSSSPTTPMLLDLAL